MLSLLLQIFVISGLGWLMSTLLTRVRPRYAFGLSTLTFAALLITTILHSVTPWTIALSDTASTATSTSISFPAEPPANQLIASDSTAPVTAQPTLTPATEIRLWTPDTLLLLWIIGAVLFGFCACWRYRRLSLIARQAQTMNGSMEQLLPIRLHPQVSSPFLWGILNPVIVLPERAVSWPDAVLNDVISHELSHYQNHDNLFLSVGVWTTCIFWWNPLTWGLLRQHRNAMEQACDARVVNAGNCPFQYAQSLLAVARNMTATAVTASMANHRSALGNRIGGILYRQSRHPRWVAVPLAVLTIGVFGILACSKIQMSNTVSPEQMVTFVGHDLRSVRHQQVPDSLVQIAVFYDGRDDGNTRVMLELENTAQGTRAWLPLGPLPKFTRQINTWEFRLKPDSRFTGQLRVENTINDGVVDGVAVGILTPTADGQFGFKRTQSAVNLSTPNTVCAWPLKLLDLEIPALTPQIRDHSVETISRILCGAQLVPDGTYQL